MLIARGRPAHIGHAVQTPRGQLSFIEDYYEDPKELKILSWDDFHKLAYHKL